MGFGLVGGLGGLFWLAMIYDCIQHEPDRQTWLWLLIFLNLPAAVLYFAVRVVPRLGVGTRVPAGLGGTLGRWTRRKELWNAEAAARTIGTAYHWSVYGHLLREIGQLEQAGQAFENALGKDPAFPDALWGAGSVALATGRPAHARERLEKLLELEPTHKYGSASLDYGRALLATGDLDAARTQLERHLQRWGHPDAHLLLAGILKQQGHVQEACAHLDRMIVGIRGGPEYHYRSHRHLVRKAEKLLRAWAAEGGA